MLALLLAAQLITAAPEPLPAPVTTVTAEDWQRLNQIVAPPHAHLKHATHLVIASSMIAHFADLSTTSYSQGTSGSAYREANPLLRPFAGDPVALAIAKGGLAVGLNYALLRLHEKRPKTVLVIGIAQTLAVGYVAHRNAQVLGLRGR